MNLAPFVLTAELSSFSAAARQLGVSPAAVSKAVARMESDLGVRLLERTSRQVLLTDEGRIWLEHARAALTALETGRQQLAAAVDRIAGPVRVSGSPVLGPEIARILGRVAAAHPELDVQCRFTDALESLTAGSTDIAVRVGALPDSGLLARRVHRVRWVVVASPDYLRTAPELTTPHDLSRHACLHYCSTDGAITQWELPDGIQLRPGLKVSDGNALIAAATAGVGVAQVFECTVADALRRGALVDVLPEHRPQGPPIHLLYSATKRRAARFRVVIDALSQSLFD
ncbi:MAG: LysR family transcriptional regulator [Myxococcales bacterium]|nr:LysR family transcriptional regulator [Myxococcales bacterium]